MNLDTNTMFYHSFCDEYFYMAWHQVLHGQNCSVCRGYQVGIKTSLAYLRPDLSEQWLKSEHNLTPYEVTEFSSENVYWKCSVCNHEWWATVDHRSRGRDCFDCAQEQRESSIATECKKYFKDNYNAISEYNLLKNPKTNYWLRCDIYIPNNIYVEIHGGQHYIFTKKWHKNQEGFEYKQYLDQIKKQYCQENGLYIEVDLREIKTTEDAIQYIESILELELLQYVY